MWRLPWLSERGARLKKLVGVDLVIVGALCAGFVSIFITLVFQFIPVSGALPAPCVEVRLRAAARSARPARQAPTRLLRSDGNARAHARASPPLPRSAPDRRGPDRSRADFRPLGLFALGLSAFGFAGAGLIGRLQVDRTGLAPIVVLQVVADALIFAQAAHSGALDGADVNEGVLAAVVGLDEAIALLFVEELYSSSG